MVSPEYITANEEKHSARGRTLSNRWTFGTWPCTKNCGHRSKPVVAAMAGAAASAQAASAARMILAKRSGFMFLPSNSVCRTKSGQG